MKHWPRELDLTDGKVTDHSLLLHITEADGPGAATGAATGAQHIYYNNDRLREPHLFPPDAVNPERVAILNNLLPK